MAARMSGADATAGAGREAGGAAAAPPEALVLVGSPNAHGKSAALADAVEGALAARGAHVARHDLATSAVAGCDGCGACQATGTCRIGGDAWPELASRMEACDLMFLVAPVYFAGPPACLKAALDRCQMFWARKYVLGHAVPPKRPCHLLVVGDGGDPFGSAPMEAICTSALNCANLRIGMRGENVHRFIAAGYDLARVPGIVEAALGQVAPSGRALGETQPASGEVPAEAAADEATLGEKPQVNMDAPAGGERV